MGRVALLANPDSGSGRADEVADRLGAFGADVVAIAIDEAERALAVGAERIVVAGGDGSIGLAARLASRAGVPLGVVPVGTANDFAAGLGLPDDLEQATRLAAQGARVRALEVGIMSGGNGEDERPFVNVASLGLAPAAAKHAAGLKGHLGPLAYVAGALSAALSADPIACRVVDAAGEELFAGSVWQATIACTGRFGAGSKVRADPTDGMLDAVAVEAGSRLALARRARGMRSGTLERQPGVHTARSPSFVVALEAETGFNVDGEVCARSGDVRFELAAEQVDLVVG